MWKEFFKQVADLTARVQETQAEAIEESARMIAKAIESERVVHTFGSGHSSLLAQEIFCRAGGIVPVNAILDPSFLLSNGALRSSTMERTAGIAATAASGHDIRSGDVAIIISNSGKNVAPVEMVLKMKDMGAEVIALTSLEHSKSVESAHSSKKRLFEVADIVLDNLGPAGDAALEIESVNAPMGATSGIIGGIILHAVIIEATSILAKKNKAPAIFRSVNMDTAQMEQLAKELTRYRGRIKHL